MTTYSLTLRMDHFEELCRSLLRGDGLEHAAYVLCARAEIRHEPWDRQAHRKFLSRKVIAVPDDQIVESTPNLVTWRTASFARALKEAQADGLTVAIAHNHPAGMVWFSEQDNANEPDLVQMALNRNGPDTRLLSIVLTADKLVAGQIWRHPSPRGREPLRMIRVFGVEYDLHYAGRLEGASAAVLARQALAFGHALNRDLRQLRIAIVGCGGTGSAVATLLARLGVGQIVLIDNDIVDQTNLNRLHGARQADADAMRPKVEVVARSITELGIGVRVVPIEAWVGDPACRDALRSCDFIFGCTDDHEGRLFLNRFAYYYLVPVIDIGLAIDVDCGQPPSIKALDGRVTVLGPHHTCLLCRGVIDPEIARAETLRRAQPEEYEKRKAESYVVGEGNPAPSVVTFTTELACMAVNEMILRLQGFRGPDGAAANRVRKFHLGEDRKPGHKPGPVCPICSSEAIWGRGDQVPFLGRID